MLGLCSRRLVPHVPVCAIVLASVLTLSLGRVGKAAEKAASKVETAQQDLVRAIREQNDQALYESVDMLIRVEAGDRALPLLLREFRSPVSPIRATAAIGLGRLGLDAADAFPNLFDEWVKGKAGEEPDSEWLVKIEHSLQAIGPWAIPFLKKTLNERDDHRRLYAANILQWCGSPARDAVPELTRALSSERAPELEKSVRYASAVALAEIGPDAHPAVVPLQKLMNDNHPRIRWAAAYALARIGPRAKEAVPALKQMLMSEDGNRAIAAEALGNIGAPAAAALSDALTHDDFHVRMYAAESLAVIGPVAKESAPQVVQRLTKNLKDKSLGARVEAAVALWAIDGQIDQGAKVLAAALTEESDYYRIHASRAIRRIGAPAKETVPALRVLLRARGEGAVSALAHIGPAAKAAIPDLVEAESFDALPFIGPAAIPVLMETLENGTKFERMEACQALGKLGPAAKVAVPLLLIAADDEEQSVSGEALGALHRILLPMDLRFGGYEVVPTWELIQLAKRDLQVRQYLALAKEKSEREVVDLLKKEIEADLDQLVTEVEHGNTRAALFLGRQRDLAKRALPNLRAGLRDEDILIRAYSAAAIWMITGDSDMTLPILRAAFDCRHDDIREDVLRAIVAVGPTAHAAKQLLIDALNDPAPKIRVLAAWSLWNVEPHHPAIISTLTDLIRHEQYGSTAAADWAVEILGLMGSDAKSAIPALEKVQLAPNSRRSAGLSQEIAKLLHSLQR